MKDKHGVLLSSDLSSPHVIPYFLRDEPMMLGEFRERLRAGSTEEQTRLLAKLLREARDTDVWQFISPAEVLKRWDSLAPQLGRRRKFWEFLLSYWKEGGLIGS